MWSVTLNVTDFSHQLFFQCFMLNHIVLFFYYMSYSWTTTSFWKKRMSANLVYWHQQEGCGEERNRPSIQMSKTLPPHYKDLYAFQKASVIIRVYVVLFSLLCVTFLLEKREITSSTPQQGGNVGDLVTLTATADSHHKDLSFVYSNKENLNQKTDRFRLLPLSPAGEINDRGKHTRTQVSSLFRLCLFTKPRRSCCSHSVILSSLPRTALHAFDSW